MVQRADKIVVMDGGLQSRAPALGFRVYWAAVKGFKFSFYSEKTPLFNIYINIVSIPISRLYEFSSIQPASLELMYLDPKLHTSLRIQSVYTCSGIWKSGGRAQEDPLAPWNGNII